MQSFSPTSTTVPQKLSWVTTPLLILLILQVLGLILMPFIGPLMNGIMGAAAADPEMGMTAQDLSMLKMFTGVTLWIIWFFSLLWTVLTYFTWKAVQQGKNWGRVAAIVIGVLNLLSFPIGTILGIFMLIGALDKDVQNYTTR